ncbi:mitogen-activated protein kinase kinase kinase 3 [Arabidopsis lyrata subsp. lyrata]|uniref:mitogen-activated protein kinase kinase kinase 3 n=1 Tax=Arabidopsis lyrata subsp. lyrata TaxID=81972 RepID=UPI000A29A72F|nr:mitogen-activated protein kinase kinase kinase 3 [Arabidopsis lyrata subsp. lyrata]|eukprot:XP_020871047.1 mitogen-activated protein kinase kinase kinase 3 [Arabidopsis lyrata subsp. lyrata]
MSEGFNRSKQCFKGEDSDHIRQLEEEVQLLKNLSHPNIVRYLGTVRESGSLNILMEFVRGGSISSMLDFDLFLSQ